MTDWKFILEKWLLRRHQHYTEKKVMLAMEQIRGGVFVDVGANVGLYSIALSPHFKEVYAFEPNEKLFAKWSLTPPNVHLMHFALADESGIKDFYVGPGNADTLLPVFDYKPSARLGQHHRYVGEKPAKVTVATFDSFHFPFVDLVKIDVEGAELAVLKGMNRALLERKVGHIMVEVHNTNWEGEIRDILQNAGFDVKRIDKHPHIWARLKE